MSVVKEKYVKFEWDHYKISKIILCEKDKSHFFVSNYDGDVMKLLKQIETCLNVKFEMRSDSLDLYERGNLDPLSLHIEYTGSGEDRIPFSLSSDKNSVIICKSTYAKQQNNLNLLKEILNLYEIKRVQRKIKKSLKNQLNILGYIPKKIKKIRQDKNTLYLLVSTNYGRLFINYDINNEFFTLDKIDNGLMMFNNEEEVESEIKNVEKNLDNLKLLKDSFFNINSEISNFTL